MLQASGTRRDPSRIIIVSSTAGKNVPHVGENGTIMYAVSKAAAHVSDPERDELCKTHRQQHLGRNLAIELGPSNITTNIVAPGFFPSKLASGLIEKLGGISELEDANPRKRLGEPEDIAGVMVYLCSPAGSYM
jgi:NAD(P)-dependent dehydrogenase (short-subunit alcohol dehydrogenase family)